VTLRNAGSGTFSFATCPVYDEGLKGATAFDSSYELNCGAASPIAAGGSETFAMELNIPSSTPSGQFSLTWNIQGAALFSNVTVAVT
jgi:hypothetical protein